MLAVIWVLFNLSCFNFCNAETPDIYSEAFVNSEAFARAQDVRRKLGIADSPSLESPKDEGVLQQKIVVQKVVATPEKTDITSYKKADKITVENQTSTQKTEEWSQDASLKPKGKVLKGENKTSYQSAWQEGSKKPTVSSNVGNETLSLDVSDSSVE